MQDSTWITIGLIISIVICFALPVVSFLVMQGKKLKIAPAFFTGALAFTVSQVLLRIPLLTILGQTPFMQRLSENIVLHGLFLGFTAGLFEECARFLFCKLMLKKHRRYADAVAFGFGHGGIEAVILVGVSLISSLTLYIAMNNGTLASLMDGAQAAAVAEQLSALTPLNAILGGVERIFAVMLHVAFSVMVFTGFARNRPGKYLLLAILAHTFVDAFVVIVPSLVPMSPLALEGAVMVFAALCLFYVLRAKKAYPAAELPADAAGELPAQDSPGEQAADVPGEQ
ncbi:MAG TPA: YhfC family glutamic-type intramembrane protease [Feifaniaceae bacterium]|nr:YhfC family glutamic-type intramembrane protease [Feifaniaceae bacterium]